MSKATMQDIADAVGTSRVTVWKAFNNKAGVSQALRQEILEKAKELGYSSQRSPDVSPSLHATKNIAVVVSRPESSRFWMDIIHELAIDFAQRNINLIYSFVPQSYQAGYVLPKSLTDGSVTGIIVLNVYSERLLSMLSQLELPKIFLDTPPGKTSMELRGDVLMIEGFNTMRQITNRIMSRNVKRLCFIGDIHYAQTNMDRYQGYLSALRDWGLVPDPRYNLTKRLKFEEHQKEISLFLDSLKQTEDAVICASDFLLNFVVQHYNQRKLPTKNIIFSGFDNNLEYPKIAGRYTTAEVNTRAIGQRLASGILYRINHPDSPLVTTFIHTKPIYRGSLV